MPSVVPDTARVVVVASSPRGLPIAEDFAVREEPLPPRASDQLLVRVDVLSLDPYLRSLLGQGHLDDPALGPGQVMPGRAVATVLESDDPSLPVGSLVLGETGWREHAVLPVALASPVRVPERVPASATLGLLGMPGLTAYAAHVRHLAPRPGETVVVSSATGGVGSLAGQLAARSGARTVGIVGSREKIALAHTLGYDQVVVRTESDWIDQLHAACPDKVDAYLHMGDQATLDGVVEHLALGARVSLCGLIDQSNGAPPTRFRAGAVMLARATVRGLVVHDHADLAAEHAERVGALLATGALGLVEDTWNGLEQAGAAFEALMSGRNRGKVVVQLHREGE